MANANSCRIPNLTNLRRKEMKKNEVCKKRKTKVASEDNAYLQVLTIKENAQTELAKDSSTSAVTMKDSLQLKVQPYLSMVQNKCSGKHKNQEYIAAIVHDKEVAISELESATNNKRQMVKGNWNRKKNRTDNTTASPIPYANSPRSFTNMMNTPSPQQQTSQLQQQQPTICINKSKQNQYTIEPKRP
ncbi:hypothetical protein KIW84_066081 [Lathyrus oleraceus]|uniref:Uncharacterized protein n=1 Tax=Pisum sativum TaxID=3888 RepID=A0A9D4WIW8_PEA|nr:hypothetical protein KIW84_066081 [Pisum sativum]